MDSESRRALEGMNWVIVWLGAVILGSNVAWAIATYYIAKAN